MALEEATAIMGSDYWTDGSKMGELEGAEGKQNNDI
jgi:hypothetical protein